MNGLHDKMSDAKTPIPRLALALGPGQLSFVEKVFKLPSRVCDICGLAALLAATCVGAANSPTDADSPAEHAAGDSPIPVAAKSPARRPEPARPATAREFFNAGAQNLGAGKLAEAETLLERALASQNARLQPAALYNLGHVRFGEGIEELKKGPSAGLAANRSRTAARQGEEAIGYAEQALADNDVGKMVQSYLRGRGARKELKAATAAVRRALDIHGAALAKWQRASGDFKSAVELNDTDADSRFNAEVVDRNVAKLVDSVHELQQCAGALGDKSRELSEKLKQLKGRIPAAQMPPGAAGDDEDDEDSPFGLQPGQKEGPSKEGQEIPLSPEQAGWLLEAFKLDRERHLPMGQGAPAQPRDRSRPDW